MKINLRLEEDTLHSRNTYDSRSINNNSQVTLPKHQLHSTTQCQDSHVRQQGNEEADIVGTVAPIFFFFDKLSG
jgi:hypothetical protein